MSRSTPSIPIAPEEPRTEAACPQCGHDVDHTTACPVGCPKCDSPRQRFIDNVLVGGLTERDREYLNRSIDAILAAEARPTPVEPEAPSEYQKCEQTHAHGTTHWHPLRPRRLAVEPDGLPLDVDERNWLAGEGTIAAAMGGERLMARNPIVKAAYDRGRSDGVLFGTPSEAKP